MNFATHLVFVMSASWFKCMRATYQYSLLIRLCNNSDEILALRLETSFGIDNHYSLFSSLTYL